MSELVWERPGDPAFRIRIQIEILSTKVWLIWYKPIIAFTNYFIYGIIRISVRETKISRVVQEGPGDPGILNRSRSGFSKGFDLNTGSDSIKKDSYPVLEKSDPDPSILEF